MLGDGDDADALAPEHGLEGHGVLRLRVKRLNFQARLSDICILIAKSGSFRAVIEVAYTNPYTMARPVHKRRPPGGSNRGGLRTR